jgi:membrane dipeptidase
MARISVFDAHCDTIALTRWKQEGIFRNSGMVQLEQTSQVFGRYSQIFALFTDCTRPGHSTYDQLLGHFHAEVAKNSGLISHCFTASDADRAHAEGKAAAFLSVEGAELLDCDPARLDQAAADGVIAINLTWNHANAISGSCREETDRGLSEQGRRFVSRMEALKIFVDVSHLSDPGFWDVIEMAERPVIASHSNARAVWNHSRNLTDAQITAIIKNRGIIGLNFFRDFIGHNEDFATVRAHLDHMLDMGAEKQVALGGDWDGCDTITELPSVTSLTDLYEHLLAHGYPESLVCDLFYNNLMRVVRQR